MSATPVNMRDVGRSPGDVIRTSGREGLATIVGFWMFAHSNDRQEFWGSVNTAVRRVWGEDAAIDRSTTRAVSRRLTRNGFRFVMAERGPRWIAPDVWRWEHHDDDEDATPIDAPPPAPVRTSYACPTCGETFPTPILVAQHTASAHGRAPRATEKAAVAFVRDHPDATNTMVAEHLGVTERTAQEVLSRMVAHRRLTRRRGERTGRYGMPRYLYTVPRRRTPDKTVVVNPAPVPTPPVETPQRPAETPESTAGSNGHVILGPDGVMYRVVRVLPGGAMELERL